MIAKGTFEIAIKPQADDSFEVGRMTIDKAFSGDMTGRGLGQMLSVRTAVEGSAGYVAIERVTAALEGRSGEFYLQHSGTMNRGDASLALSVIPDSATGELEGLTGKMTIDIVDGQHFYEFTYSFSSSKED